MSPELFIGLTLFGVFVGVMSGFFGIGGGAFLVPFLVRLGGLGWDQAIALSLAQMVPMSAVGAWRRWRQGESHVKLAAYSLAGSIPGAWLGRTIVRLLGERGTLQVGGVSVNVLDTALSLIFFGFLCWMGQNMWRTAAAPPGVRRPEAGAGAEGDSGGPENSGGEAWPFPPIEAWLLGLAVGTTSALLGIGGGFLFVPIAVQRFGLPVALAVGASLLQIPVTGAVGAALYVTVPGTPFLWLIPLLLGSLVGVVQGVALSKRFDNKQLKRLLAGMLMGVAVLVIVSWYRNLGSA